MNDKTVHYTNPLLVSKMALLWNVVSVSFSLFYTPFLMFLLGMIFLASIGKSLGVRRLYVQILIKIFEVNIKCLLPRKLKSQCNIPYRKGYVVLQFINPSRKLSKNRGGLWNIS